MESTAFYIFRSTSSPELYQFYPLCGAIAWPMKVSKGTGQETTETVRSIKNTKKQTEEGIRSDKQPIS